MSLNIWVWISNFIEIKNEITITKEIKQNWFPEALYKFKFLSPVYIEPIFKHKITIMDTYVILIARCYYTLGKWNTERLNDHFITQDHSASKRQTWSSNQHSHLVRAVILLTTVLYYFLKGVPYITELAFL